MFAFLWGVPVGPALVNSFSCPRRELGTRSKEVPTVSCLSFVRGWSGLGCFPPFAVATMMSWIGLCKDPTATGSAQNPTRTRMCQALSGRNPCFPAPEPGLSTSQCWFLLFWVKIWCESFLLACLCTASWCVGWGTAISKQLTER